MRRNRFRLAALILPLALTAMAVQAANSAAVDDIAAGEAGKVKADYHETVKALKTVAEQNKDLQKQQASIQNELRDLQGDLVEIAGKIKQQERVLLEMETGLAKLDAQEKIIAADFRERQTELSQLLQSMVKLSKVPPELVVAMPGDFSDTMRTAKILGLSSRALSDKAAKVRIQLDKVHSLQAEIAKNRDTIRTHKAALENDQGDLEQKLATRGELQNQLHKQQSNQESELEKLSEASSTLRDLLSQLEAKHKQDGAAASTALNVVPSAKPASPTPAKPRNTSGAVNFTAAKGKISLPAEGKIFSFYGDKTDDGAQARGITIETRGGAQVTALFGGEVVYTGPFRDYGNLVIVRHEGDFHTLLAGLKRITCQPGQTVLEGEPIGEMGSKEQETALYMEIRKDNRPIDPMPWLGSDQTANKRQTLIR